MSVGCQDSARDLPTRGKLTMISSEDIFPVIDKEVKEFEQMYEQVHVTHVQSTTRDAIVQLLNDSVKVVTTPRQFNDEEKGIIKKYKLEVDTFKIAYDAAVVLVNEKNSRTRIKVEELRNILLGKVKTWRELGDKSVGPVVVALGEPNSGMYEYIKNRITDSQPFADVVVPCSTTTDVIAYVAGHSNAIGFAGSGWISSTPPKTRIVDIGDPEYKRDSISTTLEYFPPLQAHVYRNYYPLRRTLYLFSKNVGTGVGIGFTAFVLGAQGQKLFLKNGLVPATMPVRLIQLQSQ
jgi:phosphate transport system substrate-binding protein